jgi:hypothetical protein
MAYATIGTLNKREAAGIESGYHGGNFSYHIKELVSININLAIANVSPFYPGFPCVFLCAVPSKFPR